MCTKKFSKTRNEVNDAGINDQTYELYLQYY